MSKLAELLQEVANKHCHPDNRFQYCEVYVYGDGVMTVFLAKQSEVVASGENESELVAKLSDYLANSKQKRAA